MPGLTLHLIGIAAQGRNDGRFAMSALVKQISSSLRIKTKDLNADYGGFGGLTRIQIIRKNT